MRITPLDIHQKHFSRRYKGCDMEEVKAFLELISGEVEELQKENASLKEEVKGMESQLKEFHDLEAALFNTVVKTQEFVETYKASTKKNAEHLQKEAESKAEEVLKESQQKIVEIHEEITHLKGIRKHFKEEMGKLIEDNLEKFR